ncbi:MAG: two-component system response regulator [Promethearchaeota archaeon Loki_b32]|nr:MAG: two-component system response regulator [Candidatus Lokiarchaeota archaeon Loki_b32]
MSGAKYIEGDVRIKTIFIAEDDRDLQRLYELLLGMSGFQVLSIANNGEEAIKMFRSFAEKPDIIILDYRMPIKNGLDALKEILQIDHNSRVIFASADKTIKDEVYSNGAMGFLDKPFTHQRLITTLNKCLDAGKLLHS